ncbi:CppA N-terminal domain-containing protein [Streptococcus sobrinus]|uniref:CppA N-terminal domain-containing protein n=1 Tax=Streptococcus sobrinus TaxID=1310 RepID=UPI000304B4DD|nr:CppA N-terminal domain-containing protein [Streptococcus sobrinus]
MTLFSGITLVTPVLRINNRERNTEFYRKNLGFKVLKEENSQVFFGGHQEKLVRFSIEESPSMRVRAVEGPKKLASVIIKAEDPKEIESLLASGVSFSHLFKGEKGYAYEILSPENDVILLHAENDWTGLEEISREGLTFSSLPNFQGLSNFTIEQLILNVADLPESQAFYKKLAGLDFLPDLQEAQGEDLKAAENTTWDLEFIEYHVPADYDFLALKVYFEEAGLSVYLDRGQRVLVVSDPSQIELWFSK